MADDSDEETREFINSLKNVNTSRKTTSDVKMFQRWMVANDDLRNIEDQNDMSAAELDKALARFFMKITKEDGKPYEPTTIKSFQSSISRHLLEKRKINIITDKEFSHSREVLSAKMKQLKSLGMGAKKRRADPFTTEEINLLYEKEFLGSANPKSLIRTVWLNNTLHFGLRSREEHSTLRWGDLQMKETTDGLQYLEHTERATKTRPGTNPRETRAFQAKMFADPGNDRCPIALFKHYITHRPEDMFDADNPFYLGINKNIKDNVWFSRQPMGKNTLYNFVRDMCEEAGIEGRKTNHSARKTTVTALVHENIPDTRIMQLSGHRNVQSINAYSTASLEQQRQMSNILSAVGTGQSSRVQNKNCPKTSQHKSSLNDDINVITEMPDADDEHLLSASQEAELSLVLKDISNFETEKTEIQPSKPQEVPEIVKPLKDKVVQMFSGATVTGNITINFSA